MHDRKTFFRVQFYGALSSFDMSQEEALPLLAHPLAWTFIESVELGSMPHGDAEELREKQIAMIERVNHLEEPITDKENVPHD